MPEEDEYTDESSPQELIAIIDDILGPIRDPEPRTMARSSVHHGPNCEPIPQPPPTPPRTPPPVGPPPSNHAYEQNRVSPWDLDSNEEAQEAEPEYW
jgi:hypothetical protein